MPFERPSLRTIKERIRADLRAAMPTLDSLPVSLPDILAKALAGASFTLHGHIDYLARNMLPDTAETEILERWAAIWGIARKPPAVAEGFVIFTGEEGAKINAGALLQGPQAKYSVTRGGAIALGVATLLVKAATSGSIGNAVSGRMLTLVSPIAGIRSEVAVAESGIVGGADDEADSRLRARLIDRIRNQPQGGAPHDYIRWAREVPGVAEAFVYPLIKGPGTVGVTFTLEGESVVIPGPESEIMKTVTAHVKEQAPVTASVEVFALKAMPLTLELRVVPTTDRVKAAVTAEVKDFLKREARAGGAWHEDSTIYLSRLREAISLAEGEVLHELVLPTKDVKVGLSEIVTFGGIAWL